MYIKEDKDIYFKNKENTLLIPLKEKLYSIQEDVDYIYNTYFKGIVDTINKDSIFNKNLYDPSPFIFNVAKSFGIMNNNDILFGGTYSDQLKSIDCKKVHNKQLCFIFVGIFNKGSYYMFEKNTNMISISLHHQAMNAVSKYPISKLKNKQIKHFLSEQYIKGTIAHELTHWIDDAVYNIFNNIIKGETDRETKEIKLLLNKKDVNLTYFEIQSQIHMMAQLKDYYANTWDSYTLNEIIKSIPSLEFIAEKVYYKYGDEVLKLWIKKLLVRMNREGLLGENMNQFDIKKFKESVCNSMNIIY